MKKIKMGILGVGRAGFGMHAQELKNFPDLFTIEAACDIDLSRRENFQTNFPSAKVYDNIDEMLKNPDLELISIATRSPEHVEHALKALAAGKIVFLEKPVAITRDGMIQLEEALKKYPGKLYFRHNRRFEAPFVQVREIVASGILGEIFMVKLRRNSYQLRSDWQTIEHCGGGQINNWGPHIIDHALRFIDGEVVDLWSDFRQIAASGDADDHLKIILRGANKLVVDLEISNGSALSEPEYFITGDRGALICRGDDIELKYIKPGLTVTKDVATSDNPPVDGGYGHTRGIEWVEEKRKVDNPSQPHDIWKHLYHTLRDNVPFPIRSGEALDVVRITQWAKENYL